MTAYKYPPLERRDPEHRMRVCDRAEPKDDIYSRDDDVVGYKGAGEASDNRFNEGNRDHIALESVLIGMLWLFDD